ncbi:hypothetical protein ACWATR_00020 [Nostoc sp. UIC 10890]|jgi:predicted transposase YbfD/YdcC
MDVTFHEDTCRVRTGHAPQNLALLRRIALNALNVVIAKNPIEPLCWQKQSS